MYGEVQGEDLESGVKMEGFYLELGVLAFLVLAIIFAGPEPWRPKPKDHKDDR